MRITTTLKNILKMNKINSILVAVALVFLTCMCNINAQFGIKGNGNVIEQKRELPVFTGVSTSNAIDVYVTQSDIQSVIVVADDNIQQHVKTEVKDDILNISFDKTFHWNSNIKVLISMKDITLLEASGASDIFVENPIIVGNLKVEVSGGSDIRLNVKGVELRCDVSGGSDAFLKGAIGYLYVDASGGSDCKAFDLISAKANIDVSGGSDAFITVSDELSASASGGSDIKYKGSPRITKIDSSGGSDIIKE